MGNFPTDKTNKTHVCRRLLDGNPILLLASNEFLRCIFEFEGSRNQRQGSESFTRKVDFTRWFSIAFLINGVFIATRVGFELKTPVLWVHPV